MNVVRNNIINEIGVLPSQSSAVFPCADEPRGRECAGADRFRSVLLSIEVKFLLNIHRMVPHRALARDFKNKTSNIRHSLQRCPHWCKAQNLKAYRHGEQWRRFRSKVQRPILQPQTVKKYVTPIERVTDDFLQYMAGARDGAGDLPADFDNDIHRWSLECIGRVALDVRLGCLSPELTAQSQPQKIIDAAKFALRNVAVLELKAPYWRYVPTPLWTKYVNNMNFFVELCSRYISEALERLKTKKVTSEDDLSLLERVLRSEGDPKIATIMALDLILVGIDTISMAVCSILYQAATRPEQQEKVAQEIRRELPDPDKPLTYSDLDKLQYTKAFVREVFRMYSTVIGNGRTLQEDDVICGYHVPKGVQVVFPTVVTGNMSEFVSDPEEFKPERWLEPTGRLHPFASLPYGFGARICLGRRFADLEIQVLLAKLLRKYRLEYHHEPLEYAVTFMYAPHGPLKLRMIER
ncbi:Probable cytochrome P450 301a1, mitochondrial [Eumeta japonica]|uniref:Probable cytochrome P450 301a1, mitochondrial n=1 Tax=Eumeta variegata TaxID=151549 RepID=A0A4C1XGA3_EUMVA|nr:Probable cytochrome P450 301a1, mitochondrial [Eumeta japonica]